MRLGGFGCSASSGCGGACRAFAPTADSGGSRVGAFFFAIDASSFAVSLRCSAIADSTSRSFCASLNFAQRAPMAFSSCAVASSALNRAPPTCVSTLTCFFNASYSVFCNSLISPRRSSPANAPTAAGALGVAPALEISPDRSRIRRLASRVPCLREAGVLRTRGKPRLISHLSFSRSELRFVHSAFSHPE